MPKLTDLQIALLSGAAARDDRSLLPLPTAVTATRARIDQAVATLIKRGLAEEATTKLKAIAHRAEGRKLFAALITETGRQALSKPAPAAAPEPVLPAEAAAPTATKRTRSKKAQPAPAAPAPTIAPPRNGTRQRQLYDLLRQDGGATTAELMAHTGWLPHTTRAAVTGLRKLGFAVQTDREASGTRYRITGQ